MKALIKENIQLSSETQSFIIMVARRQMWCWESYILHSNRKWSEMLGVAWAYETSKPISTETHFLQKGHTYSNKATPPNSATPFVGHSFQTITTSELKYCQRQGNMVYSRIILQSLLNNHFYIASQKKKRKREKKIKGGMGSNKNQTNMQVPSALIPDQILTTKHRNCLVYPSDAADD